MQYNQTKREITMNSNNHPLQLPWLARRAGLSNERAEALWREASAYAVRRTGSTDSSAYAQVAMDKLHALIDAESSRLNTLSPVRTWARLQRHYWSLQLTWLEAGNTIATRTWRTLSRTGKSGVCTCCS